VKKTADIPSLKPVKRAFNVLCKSAIKFRYYLDVIERTIEDFYAFETSLVVKSNGLSKNAIKRIEKLLGLAEKKVNTLQSLVQNARVVWEEWKRDARNISREKEEVKG